MAIGGYNKASTSHTKYTVKGQKIKTAKTPTLKGMKAGIKLKSPKAGKKTTSTAHPLKMKLKI